MANLTTLMKLVIDGDSKGAQAALRETGGEVKSLSKLAKAGGAVLAGLATTIGAMAISAINAQDQIAKLSDRTGVAVETLSTLKVAGEFTDVSIESLARGVAKMSRVIVEADKGGAKAKETLAALGISARSASGGLITAEDALRKSADAFASLEGGVEKAALAQDLFGRGGIELLTLLNDGSDGLDRMTDRAQALGLAMSEDGTRKAEQFNDTLTALWQTSKGWINTAVDSWLPTLTDLAGGFELLIGGATAADRQMQVALARHGTAAERRAKVAANDEANARANDPEYARAAEAREKEAAAAAAAEAARAKAKADAEERAAADAAAFAAATRDAAAAERERAQAVADVAREQEEQQRFEADFAAQMIDRIAEVQEQDDRRREYEIEQEREKVEQIAEIERAAADERAARREQEARDAQATQQAQVSTAQTVFGAISRVADLAYGAIGDSAAAGTAKARAAMKVLFVTAKAAALAGAIVSTAQAVTNALATPPFPAGAVMAVGAGIAGAAQIATIVATTIAGVADGGLMPSQLRAAGLNRHTVLAVRNDEAVVPPDGTRELTAMLQLQRRRMEIGANGGPGGAPIVVVAELDGRRMTRGLSPHMSRALEDGYDVRRDARVT